jgi:hypothetical protein
VDVPHPSHSQAQTCEFQRGRNLYQQQWTHALERGAMGKKVNDQEAFDIASSLDLKVWVVVPVQEIFHWM